MCCSRSGSPAPAPPTPANSSPATRTPMTREQAQALAIDLSRRSTPAEGGFCTFQPVVDGGACPWNLDCHNCDKFVLSGADLLYWRRKREQWRQLAEGAPDDATADYLHRYFEPTARAIDGLEKALAGLGLLDQALALDLRKPQDYFHRVWSTAFRATDLAATGSTAHDDNSHTDDDDRKPAHDRSPPDPHRAPPQRWRPGAATPKPRSTASTTPSPGCAGRRPRSASLPSPAARACPARSSTPMPTRKPLSPRRSGRPADQRSRLLAERDDAREATWRERALNAEDALKAAHAEILAQRTRIGELLGRIRDLEAEWTQDADPADHHREHHPQTARPPAHRRQPHPRRTTQGRPLQPALPRPPHRRPRSAADRACQPHCQHLPFMITLTEPGESRAVAH